MATLEKQILDHLGAFIRREKYQPSKEEDHCIKKYDMSPPMYVAAFFTLDLKALWPDSPKPTIVPHKSPLTASTPPSPTSTPAPTPTPTPTPAPIPPHPTSPTPPTTIPTTTPRLQYRPPPPPNGALTPRWLAIWGIAAITAGAFATTFYSSKIAARQCIQCFIDVEDKKSQLYLTVRQLLKDHHPDAHVYFRKEKNLDRVEGVDRGEYVEQAEKKKE
ncbi:hypothetical protein HDV00_007370 [Rhizophlyctis rosea]|nr:hypothetical protein HDV00_007370 [Rhizophlyctis rosea]